MQLDRKLNIVIPVDRGADTIYIHATPISRAVFDNYYLIIAKTWSAITGQGLNSASAPRVALLLLRDVAKSTVRVVSAQDQQQIANWLDGDSGVEQGLLPEIFRLTNAVLPTPQGWQQVTFEEARQRKLLDDDDLAEVENILVFFTLASLAPPKRDRAGLVGGVAAMWNALTTSSNSTEYLNSLPTSKETVSSGEKAIPSATIY